MHALNAALALPDLALPDVSAHSNFTPLGFPVAVVKVNATDLQGHKFILNQLFLANSALLSKVFVDLLMGMELFLQRALIYSTLPNGKPASACHFHLLYCLCLGEHTMTATKSARRCIRPRTAGW